MYTPHKQRQMLYLTENSEGLICRENSWCNCNLIFWNAWPKYGRVASLESDITAKKMDPHKSRHFSICWIMEQLYAIATHDINLPILLARAGCYTRSIIFKRLVWFLLYRAKYDVNDEISPSRKNLYEDAWNNNNRFIVLKVQSRTESRNGSRYGKWECWCFPYVVLILLGSGICHTPHQAYKCGTRPVFLDRSGRRTVAHTRPAVPKMPRTPSAFS